MPFSIITVHLQHLPRAGIIHRLDKDTTGLLVMCENPFSPYKLIRQMQAREIQRHYITLVQGHLISGGKIEYILWQTPQKPFKNGGLYSRRASHTHYSIRKQYQEFTLLDVQLMTGRTHQIRVHMAHINHPVVGDPLYGGRMRFPCTGTEELRNLFKQFKRQALHACKLSFRHPETEELLTFEAPLPDDFKSLLNALDEHFD